MYNDLVIDFLRMFFMNLGIIYSFIRIKNIIKIKMLYVIFILIVNGIICLISVIILENIITRAIVVSIVSSLLFLIISSILLNKLDNGFFIVTVLAILIYIMMFMVASFISFIITRIEIISIIENSFVETLLISFFQVILTYSFFKIRKFKNGFQFIENKKLSRNLNIICIFFSTIVICYIVFLICNNKWITVITFFSVILGFFFALNFIQHLFTKHYKLKMKDRTVEILQEQIAKKDVEIANLKDELAGIHKINHKYSHRISAMEKAISNLEFNEEFAKEHGEIIELVKQLSEEYKTELNSLQKNSIKTGNTGVDNILEYMRQKAINNNIEFNMKTETNIKEFENHIENNRLETFLADHINDAIIAIKFSSNKTRKILVTFQKINKNCAIKIYDTGIEFEIDTLTKLGTQSVTTHKETRRKRNRIYDNI